jgi:hypothetical protein
LELQAHALLLAAISKAIFSCLCVLLACLQLLLLLLLLLLHRLFQPSSPDPCRFQHHQRSSVLHSRLAAGEQALQI